MPPVMTAETAIAHSAEQEAEARPEGGAGQHDEEEDAVAAAGQVEQTQAARRCADSTPSRATVAPFIVPRRTSSMTAATTSAPTDRGDKRRVAAACACVGSVDAGSQNG